MIQADVAVWSVCRSAIGTQARVPSTRTVQGNNDQTELAVLQGTKE